MSVVLCQVLGMSLQMYEFLIEVVWVFWRICISIM